MDLIDIIKNNPLYAVLATILTFGFGYLLKVSFSQRKSIKTAGEKIITAFQPELDRIIQSSEDCGCILDDAAFRKHEAAVRNNINDLSIFQRGRLRKAWEKLAYHKENKQIPFYEMYYGSSISEKNELRKKAISRIHKIIKIVK
ncbi:MAG: hypothetical protein ACU836_13320 [Gammaproteobacteria bacterium]